MTDRQNNRGNKSDAQKDAEKAVNVGYVGPLFGEPVFSIADTDKTFASRGTESTPCVEVVLPLLPHGIRLPMTIWARKATQANGSQIKFEAAMPQVNRQPLRTMDTDGGDAIDNRDAILAHVETAVIGWNGFEKAQNLAIERLTSAKLPKADKDANRPVRPTLGVLVKDPASQRPANQPTV